MIKLIILTGGTSLEKDISLKSCENILQHINKKKYIVKVLNVGENLDWIEQMMKFSPDVVFSTLHGGAGEDGTIQGMLDMLSVKYIGSGTLASSLCIDKKFSKDIMKFNKIPVLEDVFLKRDQEVFDFESQIREIGFPLIVKPNKCGASIGVHLVYNMIELENAVLNIKKLNEDILIEKYAFGKEVTCCVMEKQNSLFVLPLLDINAPNGIFDFSAKYKQDGNVDFSKLPKFLQNMIEEIAKKVFRVLKCGGLANIDFIIKEEEIYVLEVNTIPGFTEKSLLPKAIEGMGMSFEKFLDELIEFKLVKSEI